MLDVISYQNTRLRGQRMSPGRNDTYTADPDDAQSVPYTIILLFVSVLIIGSNLKVVCLYCWKKKHILTILHNRILLSLSICDLMNGTTVMLSAICHYKQTKEYVYRILIDIFTTFLVKTTIMHLCGITVDRYLSLFFALRYRAIVTRRAAHLFIIVAWILPLATSLIAFSWLHKFIGTSNDEDYAETQNTEICYSIVSFLLFVGFPMLLLGGAFIHMFMEIRRLMSSTPRHHCTPGLSPCKRRLIYIFGSMYTSFAVLAMPYFGLRLWNDIHYWSDKENLPPESHMVMVRISIVLKAMTSFVNPLLYSYSSPDLRLISEHAKQKFLSSSSIRRCRRMSTDAFRKISTTHQTLQRRVGRVETPDIEALRREMIAEESV